MWHSSEGKELLLKSLNTALNTQDIKSVKVFTNDNEILNYTNLAGVKSYLIDSEPEIKDSILMPPGSYTSIKYMNQVLKADFEKLIIINFRNPLLTPDLLKNAVNKYNKSKALVLTSVRKPIDHPCQLKAYYKIIDVGLIHLFDDESLYIFLQQFKDYMPQRSLVDLEGTKFKITRPFYFDWESMGVEEKCESGIYTRIQDGFQIGYNPIKLIGKDKSPPLPFFFWLYESSHTARILFRYRNDNIPKLPAKTKWTGAAFCGNTVSAMLYEYSPKSSYYISFSPDHLIPGPFTIKVLPISGAPNKEHRSSDIQTQSLTTLMRLPFDRENKCGFTYSILKPAIYDFSIFEEYFPPVKNLWDIKGEKAVNTKTGCEIQGRQNFPDVFEPDGSITIIKNAQISLFEKTVENGKSIGFFLDESNSISIESKFDILRYKAVNKARA